MLQRPARTTLTALGTVLGVGTFTAILGLTATTEGQVSKDFTVLAATQVVVKDIGSQQERQGQVTLDDFPPDADAIIERLNGVIRAGVTWPAFPSQIPKVSTSAVGGNSHNIEVDAASPGYVQALGATIQSGVVYNNFHNQRRMRVAVVGSAAAAQLGIHSVATSPAIFINGTGFTVIGILGDVARNPDDLLKILIPDQTAIADYGSASPDAPPTMLIETKLGAAPLVARQAPTALRPDQPALLQAVPPPDPHQLSDTVTGHLSNLFLLLAGLTLLIGAAGIANTTLVSVMERVTEIGLRRALGARPRHIAGQFLAESSLLGTLGGLIGTAIGITTTAAVAILHHWTAVLDPGTTLPAPLIGTIAGLTAGLYPALRAARIEPLEALRR